MELLKMSFEQFNKKVKTINSKQYADDYFRLNQRHCVGCHYYLYIDEDLQVINPFTKKDKGKKVFRSFASTVSRDDVIKKAFDFINSYGR